MTMAETIDEYADILDSRDIIARLQELESLAEDEDLASEMTEDEWAELRSLRVLNEEGERQFDSWAHGVTLIRHTFMADYVKEYAADELGIEIGTWPYNCIDWKQAALWLSIDYARIEFRGVGYYGRG